MSEIELVPCPTRLEDEEVKTLHRLLDQAGAKYSAQERHQTTQIIAARLSEDAMTEFLDRLEAHDIGRRHLLAGRVRGTALRRRLPGRLGPGAGRRARGDEGRAGGRGGRGYEDDEEEEEEDEEDDEGTVIEAQLRNIWRLVNDACGESIDKNVPLHLRI